MNADVSLNLGRLLHSLCATFHPRLTGGGGLLPLPNIRDKLKTNGGIDVKLGILLI